MKQFYFIFLLLLSILSFAELTPPAELQTHYNTINFSNTGLTLKSELSMLTISKHTNTLIYGWEATQATDLDPSNSSNVLLIYGWEDGSDSDCTNDLEKSVNSNGGSNCDFNREHVYTKSLGIPPMDNSGPGADGQHIRLQMYNEMDKEKIKNLAMEAEILLRLILELIGIQEMNGKVMSREL